MPDFLPFVGIRYDVTRLAEAGAGGPGDVGAVAAPPYDVIDEDDRTALEAAHPQNSVRLILPRADGSRDPYQAAADTMAAWLDDGILVADDEPRFYLYGIDFEDEAGRPRHTHGVIGALALPGETSSPSVLPHERTMPRTKSDRLALLQATRANLDPIWCLSLASGLSDLLEREGEELASCVDGEGIRHHLRALADDSHTTRIAEAVAGAPVVIADGHHRFETACAYRDELLAAGRDDPGGARIMAFIVELADDELFVRAIHRVLTGLGGVDPRAALAAAFEVVGTGPNTPEGVAALTNRMRQEGGLGLVDSGGLALLVPRPDVLEPALAAVDEPVREVDATVFDLGVRPHLPADVDVGYRSDAAVVAALVEKGVTEAAVLLRPVTVGQIRAAAFAGARMPEKTTYFHPKPRTGMVFRSLDR
ncbi:MAG: DUF1015 domain-containing protein [Actinobacteria bacterium]|nr:DUF1015 domain-containing protein [Actinomycetota bacterium]